MTLFILLTTHFAVSYLHALLGIRFYPLRKEDSVASVFLFAMVAMCLLHLFYGLSIFCKALQWHDISVIMKILGLWVTPFLPPVMIPIFWGELTKLSDKPNFIATKLHFLAKHDMACFKFGLVISITIVITSFFSIFPLAQWDTSLWQESRYSLYYVLALSAIWLLMLLSGLRPSDSQITTIGTPFRVLMFVLVLVYFIAFFIDPSEFWWSLIPIVSTISVTLTFSWYRFRLQFMDMIFNQLVQITLLSILVIGLGWSLTKYPAQSFQTDDHAIAIGLVLLMAYALLSYFIFRIIQEWFQSLWRPSEARLRRIHGELPQALTRCLDHASAINVTEAFLAELFNAEIAINTPVEHPAHTVIIAGHPSIKLDLAYINGWVPWLSESLQWIDTAGRYLQSHLGLLDNLNTIQNQERQKEVLAAMATRSQLTAMRAQIRPHFLFNTLNSIHSFIRDQPEKAENTIIMLADLMRGVLQTSNNDRLPLQQELDLAVTYLKIEKIRHGSRLEYRLDIEPGTEDKLVPSFTIQPLVENAVKHAVESQLKPVLIIVNSQIKNNSLILRVEDDGPGSIDSNNEGLGMALNNIRERLNGLYGDQASLTCKNKSAGGYLAKVIIPLSERMALT